MACLLVVVIVAIVVRVGDLGVVLIVRNFYAYCTPPREGTLGRVDICCLRHGVQVCV